MADIFFGGSGTVRSIDRRSFLKLTVLGVASACGCERLPRPMSPAELRFGVVTDVHYADRPAAGDRYYRDSLAKLQQCVSAFNEEGAAFAVQLGDFVDGAGSEQLQTEYLRRIQQVFGGFAGRRFFVLGNHDVVELTKDQFIGACGGGFAGRYYSFDFAGWHFVVLDANYKADGSEYAAGNFDWTDAWIPGPQQQWLADDLAAARGKNSIVFIHHNLDHRLSGGAPDPHIVRNAHEVRAILEKAGNVRAVIQGHDHRGFYQQINGIHYLTLKAMVTGPAAGNNAFAVVTCRIDGAIAVRGFGNQTSQLLCKQPSGV